MAHGDGTIKLISNPGEPERWEVCVSLGKDPVTHKYKRRKRQVEGTHEQAEAMPSRDRYSSDASTANRTAKQLVGVCKGDSVIAHSIYPYLRRVGRDIHKDDW